MNDLKKAADPRTPFKPPKKEDVQKGASRAWEEIKKNPLDPGGVHAESGEALIGAAGGLKAFFDMIRGKGLEKRDSLAEREAAKDAAKKAAEEAAAEEAARIQEIDSTRGSQRVLATQLGQQAAGVGGPTAAQAQLQSATDQNMRSALAMAASGRGNAALAGQSAGRQRALMGQQAAQQSAALRAQEQQSAQAQLGSVLQGMQQTELGIGQQQLGREQLAAQAHSQAKDRETARTNTRTEANAEARKGFMGMGAGFLEGIVASDETMKKDKKDVPDSDVTEFYKALESKSYEYKDPHAVGASEGEKVGMMAQDVDKTELGKKLFSDGPDGKKRYDPQVLDGILLAGMKKLMKDQAYGND